MTYHCSAIRKVSMILLVAALLIVSLGTGMASAATTTPQPVQTPSSDMLCNYTVRAGDTLYAIARRFGTTIWYLASVNHLANPNYIRSGRHLYVPCWGTPKPIVLPGCWYRVQPGDNLSRIALRYGVSVAWLASVNGIPNPNKIYAGSWLRVPC